MKSVLLMLAATAFALSACSKEAPPPTQAPTPPAPQAAPAAPASSTPPAGEMSQEDKDKAMEAAKQNAKAMNKTGE
jgi:hypothetical protein